MVTEKDTVAMALAARYTAMVAIGPQLHGHGGHRAASYAAAALAQPKHGQSAAGRSC